MAEQHRKTFERVLTAPAQEMSRWAMILRVQVQLWRFCVKRLRQNNVAAMSAALSFRTIFAMIPALVLVVLIMKSVGMLEDGKRSLRHFLAASGFEQIALVRGNDESGPDEDPAEAETVNVSERIESVVADVEAKLAFRRVGPIGILLLIWTALTLLTTMERSLNRIFGAVRSRPVGKRVLLYWSTLTLGPLALLAAVYLGQQATATISATLRLGWLLAAASWTGSVCIGILVLAAVYKLLPNTMVGFRSAVGGAVAAVPLWLLAKWGFSIYVVRFVGTGNLYGALGLLPLFLLWLNLSWWVFLFGAQLAHTASNLSEMRLEEQSRDSLLGGSDLLAAAVVVARPYADGRGPVSTGHVAESLRVPDGSAQQLLDHLETAGIVCPVRGDDEEPEYVPARPAKSIQISEILGLMDSGAAAAGVVQRESNGQALVADTLSRVRGALESLTLQDAIDREK